MNSNHNKGESLTPLKDDLDKINRAYGQMGHDEPPKLLDQAILNSAHRAVEKQPHWMKFGWLHGLTTAAVFVLAFAIILNQREPVPALENGETSEELFQLQLKKEPEKEAEALLNDARETWMITSPPLDKDTFKTETVSEEVLLKVTDSMADSPQRSTTSRQPVAAPAAESAGIGMEIRAPVDAEAEKALQAIIELKQSGDESWREELDSFLKRYPDYPLPEGMKD